MFRRDIIRYSSQKPDTMTGQNAYCSSGKTITVNTDLGAVQTAATSLPTGTPQLPSGKPAPKRYRLRGRPLLHRHHPWKHRWYRERLRSGLWFSPGNNQDHEWIIYGYRAKFFHCVIMNGSTTMKKRFFLLCMLGMLLVLSVNITGIST